jgi:hypothetical protein
MYWATPGVTGTTPEGVVNPAEEGLTAMVILTSAAKLAVTVPSAVRVAVVDALDVSATAEPGPAVQLTKP